MVANRTMPRDNIPNNSERHGLRVRMQHHYRDEIQKFLQAINDEAATTEDEDVSSVEEDSSSPEDEDTERRRTLTEDRDNIKLVPNETLSMDVAKSLLVNHSKEATTAMDGYSRIVQSMFLEKVVSNEVMLSTNFRALSVSVPNLGAGG